MKVGWGGVWEGHRGGRVAKMATHVYVQGIDK